MNIEQIYKMDRNLGPLKNGPDDPENVRFSGKTNNPKSRKTPVQKQENPEHLLLDFNSGSQEAFTSIYNLLYPNVYYFAQRFVNPEDAADIAADAFFKLWKMEKEFVRISSVKNYLQVAAKNACINFLKNIKYKQARQNELIYLTSVEEETDIKASENIKAEYLRIMYLEVEKLPIQCKKVFRMAWLEGLKNQEIATRLRITKNTVKSHKMKALKVLRIALLAHRDLIITAWIIFLAPTL
jgi:RNA polymerase sigma-70 factor (family 1)